MKEVELQKDQTEEDPLISSLGTFLQTSVFVFLMVLLSKGLTYLYRIVIARSFGPESYGLFSLGFMVANIVVTISLLGLDNGLNRFIPFFRGKGEFKKVKFIFVSIFLTTLTLSLILALLMFLSAEQVSLIIFNNSSLTEFIQIFSLCIPFWVSSTILLSLLKSYERIGTYSFLFNFVQNFGKVLFLAILIWAGMNHLSIAYSYVLAILLLFMLTLLFAGSKIKSLLSQQSLSVKERGKTLKEVKSYSYPLLLLGILGSIFYWVDTFMIGHYNGATYVGWYNVAIPIAALLMLTSEMFMQLFLPMVTREYAQGNMPLIKQISKQIAKWIFMINLPVFILFLLFPGAIINLLFGSQYLGAENALRVLSAGTFISSFFTISNQLIYMVGKSRMQLVNIIFAAILNTVLNFFLIPLKTVLFIPNEGGLIGAAVATALSTLFLYGLFFIEAYRCTGIIPIRKKMANIALAMIIPLGLLLYFRPYISDSITKIAIAVALFLLIYLLNTIIFRGLDRNDLTLMRKIALNARLKKLIPSWRLVEND